MNELRINGEEIPPQSLPTEHSLLLTDWLEILRARHALKGELVTELCLDGVTFAADDASLAGIKSDAPSVIEVFTRPQAEVALETLEGLIPFLEETAQLSARIPAAADPAEKSLALRKLCEGLDILTDAVETSKKILGLQTQLLKTHAGESIAIIEADLLSILQDLAEAQAKRDRAYETELLSTHLPANLRTWATAAIPAIIR